MRPSTDGSKDEYLDALVQMEVLKVTIKDGEEWVSFRRPPSELIAEVKSLGLLQDRSGVDNPLAAISGAMSMAILNERGIPFTKADAIGVASVLNGVFLTFFEDNLPELEAKSSEAVFARSRARAKGK